MKVNIDFSLKMHSPAVGMMPARNNINASLPSQESISSCPIPLLCFACACLRFHVHGDALISHEKGSAMPWTFECHYIYIKDIKRYHKIDIDSKLRSSSAFIWRFALSPRSSSVLRALDMKALHKKVWAYLPEGKLLQVTRLQERGYLQIQPQKTPLLSRNHRSETGIMLLHASPERLGRSSNESQKCVCFSLIQWHS